MTGKRPATVTELERVAEELGRVEQARTALVARRNTLIRTLAPTTGANTLAAAARMTTTAVYKIRDKDKA